MNTEYPNVVAYIWQNAEKQLGQPVDFRYVVNTLLAMKYFPAAEWLLDRGENWTPPESKGALTMGLIRLVAIVALTIAFLAAVSVISGVKVDAWALGGLLAWCVSSTYDYALPIGGHRADPPAS